MVATSQIDRGGRVEELGKAYEGAREASEAVLHFARRGWRYGLRVSFSEAAVGESDHRMAAALCLLECAGVDISLDDRPAVQALLAQSRQFAADVDALLENAAP